MLGKSSELVNQWQRNRLRPRCFGSFLGDFWFVFLGFQWEQVRWGQTLKLPAFLNYCCNYLFWHLKSMSCSNLPIFLAFHMLYISMSRGRNLQNKSHTALLNVKYGMRFYRKPKILLGLRVVMSTGHVWRIQALFKPFLLFYVCVSF